MSKQRSPEATFLLALCVALAAIAFAALCSWAAGLGSAQR